MFTVNDLKNIRKNLDDVNLSLSIIDEHKSADELHGRDMLINTLNTHNVFELDVLYDIASDKLLKLLISKVILEKLLTMYDQDAAYENSQVENWLDNLENQIN